jgi:hypothetical protein
VVLADDVRQVTLELNCMGHEVRAGHRLRLALGSSYWPVLWPPPHRDTASLRTAGCRLRLPVLLSHAAGVHFASARCAPPAACEVLRKGSVTNPGATARRVDHGRIRYANGLTVDSVSSDDLHWSGEGARVVCTRSIEMDRPDWHTVIEVAGEMADAADGLAVAVRLDATLNGAICAQRRWQFHFAKMSTRKAAAGDRN